MDDEDDELVFFVVVVFDPEGVSGALFPLFC